MTILKVMVDDEQADELKRFLHDISIVKSVEEELVNPDASNVTYIKINIGLC